MVCDIEDPDGAKRGRGMMVAIIKRGNKVVSGFRARLQGLQLSVPKPCPSPIHDDLISNKFLILFEPENAIFCRNDSTENSTEKPFLRN